MRKQFTTTVAHLTHVALCRAGLRADCVQSQHVVRAQCGGANVSVRSGAVSVRSGAACRWIALVLLSVAFAPRPVVASCGDYVTMGRHGAHVQNTASEANAAGSTDSAADARQSAPAKKDSPCADGQCHNPCRNGQCHRAPAGLPPAPSSLINITIQQWALLVAALVDDSPRYEFRVVADRRDVASGYPPSIDHPPQNLFL